MSTTDDSNGEPVAKRTRTADADERGNIDQLVQDAAGVQLEIEKIIEQETQEVSRVQSMFAEKRLEVYARRRKYLESVPRFWLEVVCADVFLSCVFLFPLSLLCGKKTHS